MYWHLGLMVRPEAPGFPAALNMFQLSVYPVALESCCGIQVCGAFLGVAVLVPLGTVAAHRRLTFPLLQMC